MGFVPDPDATAEKAQQMMLDLGIRPEDNLLSRAIIAARDKRADGLDRSATCSAEHMPD